METCLPAIGETIYGKERGLTNGFFLAGWHSGESHDRHNLYTIVSQRMKKYLSGLEKAKSFLTFTPMPISEEGLGAPSHI